MVPHGFDLVRFYYLIRYRGDFIMTKDGIISFFCPFTKGIIGDIVLIRSY